MPRNQDAVMLFMGRVDCSCFPTALGLIDLMEEMDKDGTLHASPDVYFWAKLQWRHKGISRESLIAAYLNFKQDNIRGKAREKKRRQRMSPEMSPEKGDKMGDKLGDIVRDKTGKMSPEMSPEKGDSLPSPSSPSPAPFLPPSPPTPPVTPYNPPNPNPVTPTPFKKNAEYSTDNVEGIRTRLGINSAWKNSERARPAVAQRLCDWIDEEGLPAAKYRNLHDLICDSLEKGVSPDEIIAIALRDTGHCFSSDIFIAQRDALRKRGML